MSTEEHNNIITGVVVEALPNAMFRVILQPQEIAQEAVEATTVVDISTESENIVEPVIAVIATKPEKVEPVIAYLAGKMKFHRIRVIVGDSVDVLLDPYGGRGRIVRRHSMPDKRITNKKR